jgi:hypothetical protein
MKLWIARDKNEYLSLFRKKPIYRYSHTFKHEDWFDGDFLALIDSKSFPEITFENSPQEVELKLITK